MARSTLSRVAGLTLGALLSTRETVIVETPAWRATSLIVAWPRTSAGPESALAVMQPPAVRDSGELGNRGSPLTSSINTSSAGREPRCLLLLVIFIAVQSKMSRQSGALPTVAPQSETQPHARCGSLPL